MKQGESEGGRARWRRRGVEAADLTQQEMKPSPPCAGPHPPGILPPARPRKHRPAPTPPGAKAGDATPVGAAAPDPKPPEEERGGQILAATFTGGQAVNRQPPPVATRERRGGGEGRRGSRGTPPGSPLSGRPCSYVL